MKDEKYYINGNEYRLSDLGKEFEGCIVFIKSNEKEHRYRLKNVDYSCIKNNEPKRIFQYEPINIIE